MVMLDAFVAPKSLFSQFKPAKKWSWIALLIVLLLTSTANFMFLDNMSPEWIIDQQLMQAGEMTVAEEKQAKAMIAQTVEHTGTMAAVFSAISLVIFMAIFAGYYTLAAKTAGADAPKHSYGDWFSFSIWTQMPLLVNTIGFFVLFATAASPDLPLTLANYASINQLFLGLSVGDDFYMFAESLNLFFIWSIVIAGVGLQKCLNMSVGKSYLIAALPYLAVFGIWLLFV